MAGTKNEKKLDSHDFWEVSQAAIYLTGQACTLSARHIQDGTLRIQFNRDVAYYARGIVRDVEEGRKSDEEGLKALKGEQTSLLKQAATITVQGIGLVAGGFQITGGAAICYGSGGIACGIGIVMIAHGGNNIAENYINLRDRRTDTQGPVRRLYQNASKKITGSERAGNIAYGTIDINTSIYGAFRSTLKPDSWRLCRYIKTDYEKAHNQASKISLTIDGSAGAITTSGMWDEWQKSE